MKLQHTPHLLLLSDGGKKYLPLVGKSYWTLGRSDDNSFVIQDRWISRNHAILQRMENGEFYLIDLGSRNGSFVNGRRATIPIVLANGDQITFGQTEMEFHCPLSPPEIDDTEPESEDFTATLTVRRLISVMVIDIRDFTVLTRRLDERLLSEVMGRWFREAGEIVREHGTWVDKYIGDAIMVVWFHGAKGVSSSEMLQICHALRTLHQTTEALSDAYPLPFPLQIGAGLNTGYAMVGNTGGSGNSDYTALGDTVNAAFRLESSTKQLRMDIAVGETTYKCLSQLHPDNTFEQHTVDLKGYDAPTITYASTFAGLNQFLEKVESLQRSQSDS